MRKRQCSHRAEAFAIGLLIAFVAGCTAYQAQQESDEAGAQTVGAPGSVVEASPPPLPAASTVPARSAGVEPELAASASIGVFGEARSRYALVAPDGTAQSEPLAGAQPGEELWIIATPSVATANDAEDDAPGSGTMLATLPPAPDRGPTTIPLPLKHTDVHAAVVGYVGTVDVAQEFENPYDEKIEAVYLFPLPEKAAVSEFVMTIGERKIRGILREKEEAERIYRDARAQGYRASLLTQHRPNIFEQKVANIEPGKQIDVNIRYFHTLAYRDGWYSFVFPTVVGPRYNPPGFGDPGGGTAVSYLRPDERSSHDISIKVDVDAGVAIEALDASHEIHAVRRGRNRVSVELASRSTMPNRDFVLRFRVAGDTIKSNLLTYEDPATGQGYFTLMVYPPAHLNDLRRQPVEMVFVLDCSGSMAGQPLLQAKSAVLEALDRLRPDDTFQIMRFSDSVSRLGSGPVPADPENLRRARDYVRALDGGGGTQMIEGVRAALGFRHDPRRLRFVTFLTDGYIGNEAEIIGEVHRLIGPARIFSFGVGDSVNRFLLERMAGEGRGAVAYLGLQDAAQDVMAFFFERISHPAMTDVEIDWKGMAVAEVYPSRLPDLFVGRPVVVTGKYAGDSFGDLVVGGRAAGDRVELRVPMGRSATEHAFLPKLWARLRIADLADRQTWTEDPYGELARNVRDTALEYGLMSDYTSFVAVDASERTAGEHGTTVHQAVPVPDGVRYDTTVAGQ